MQKKKNSHVHGEIILKITRNNTTTKTGIISIRILDPDLKAHYIQLYCALELILKRKERGIFNLSLGVMSEKYGDELKKIILKLQKKNIYNFSSFK